MADADLLLPERARLLHIGLPKTGTTALQRAAAARREDLLAAGVRYPGDRINHRLAVSGLMGRRWGWTGPGHSTPGRAHWDRLMAEVAAETDRRVFISHEFASEADAPTAARFAAELGDRAHVAVTLRSLAELLPSSWQQYVKSGSRMPFETWLEKVLRDPPDLATTPTYHRRSDHADVVDRWVRAVGPDRVTVVVLDRARPELLTDAFTALLGLPAGLLTPPEDGSDVNRAMSAVEAELVRRVNVQLTAAGMGWTDYDRLVRNGLVARLLSQRSPAADEPRTLLPRWAAARATELGNRFADRIVASGVRIVGDPDRLREPPARTADGSAPVEAVPVDIAALAAAGAVLAGGGLPVAPEPASATAPRAVRVTAGLTARELAGVVTWHVRGRLTKRAADAAGQVRRRLGRLAP